MRRMGFPYSDVRGLAGVSCDGRGAYCSFTAQPNLRGDRTRSGYIEIRLRVRFDDEAPRHIPFTQVWGSNQLSTESAAVRSGIIGKNALLLELP